MLDWLIPSQLQQDIQSYARQPKAQDPMLTMEEFLNKYEREVIDPWGMFGEMEDYYFDVPQDYYDDPVGQGYSATAGGSSLQRTRTGTGWKYEAGSPEYARRAAYKDYTEQYQRNVEREAEMTPYSTIDPFSAGSIISGLGGGVGETYLGQQGIGPGVGGPSDIAPDVQLSPEMVNPLKVQDLRKLHTGYWQPLIQSQGDVLEKQHTGRMAQAGGVGSGFAGYGRRDVARELAEGSYLKERENIYSGIGERRAGALGDIYGQMESWRDVQDIYG